MFVVRYFQKLTLEWNQVTSVEREPLGLGESDNKMTGQRALYILEVSLYPSH